MPVWPIWVGLALLLALVNTGSARRRCALFVVGLAVMQVWKVTLPPDLLWIASAATWVAVARALYRIDAGARHSDTIAALTLFSAMCYIIGHVSAVFAPWVLPLIMADLFGLAALLSSGGRGLVRAFGNLVDHWRHGGRGVAAGGSGGALDCEASKARQEALGRAVWARR